MTEDTKISQLAETVEQLQVASTALADGQTKQMVLMEKILQQLNNLASNYDHLAQVTNRRNSGEDTSQNTRIQATPLFDGHGGIRARTLRLDFPRSDGGDSSEWILKSAVSKAVEVGIKNNLTRAVKTYADSVVHQAGQAVAEGAKILQDCIGNRSCQSANQTAKRLKEVAISCRGKERVLLLRRWVVVLKQFEKLSGGFARKNSTEAFTEVLRTIPNHPKKLGKLHTDSIYPKTPRSTRYFTFHAPRKKIGTHINHNPRLPRVMEKGKIKKSFSSRGKPRERGSEKMPVARPESSDSRTRIIAHVDLDCFYVQVEQRKQPELRGLPTAVVQYNEWKGGALIAVSYEARKLGVSRHMRGDDAKEVCPQIHLVQVPVARGKADLNIYRNAGSEVVSILARKGRCERASIDEVYLDLTDSAEAMLRETPPERLESINEEARKSHILGLKSEDANDAQENASMWLRRSDANHQDKLLACGALIVAELRMEVLRETQFTCSAGVAHNKMLAKLVSGMNKPAQQTVVPSSSVKRLLESLPIKKMKQLGGKLGTSLQTDLGVNTVGELLKFSEEKLQERFGINTGTWLWNIARGINGEEVQGRLLPKSHGAGKSFPGPRSLKTVASVQHWLNQLCDELNERICFDLDQNKRIAHTFTVYASAYKSCDSESYKKFPSKSCPLRYGTAKIQEDAFNLFQAGLREYIGSPGVKTLGHHHNGWGITSLSVSASKIVAIPSGTGSITKYFHGQYASPSSKETQDSFVKKIMPLSPLGSESYSELEPTDQLQHDNNVPCVGIPWKEQDSSCSSTVQTKDGSGQGASPPLPSGSGCCSLVNQTDSTSRVDSTMPTLERHKKKIKPSDKGTILKFLKSYNLSCPTPNQENVEMVKGSQPPSCSSLEENQAELPRRSLAESRSNDGSYNLDQNAQRAWNYKIDEIDHSVVDELPSEIQDEIRVWLQARQQPGMVKRPSIIKRGSIAHYFSPARNT